MQKLKELVNLSSLCKFQLLAIGSKVNNSNLLGGKTLACFLPFFFCVRAFSISRARLPRSLDQASKMLTSSYILYKFEGFQKEFLRNYYNYVHRSVGSISSDKGGGEGRGGGHPDPEIRGRPSLQKIFSALQASFWSTNQGEPGSPPPPSPWIRHCIGVKFSEITEIVNMLFQYSEISFY